MNLQGNDSAAQIFWIVNTVGKREEKPAILTMDGSQRYQLMMADGVSADFFHWAPMIPGLKFYYDPRYANDRASMKAMLDLREVDRYVDVAIAHDRYQHVDRLYAVAQALGFPVVYIEHFLPKPGYSLEGFRKALDDKVDAIVFKTKQAQEAWGYTDKDSVVIHDWAQVINRKYSPKSSKWLLWHDNIDLDPSQIWLDIRDNKDLPIEVRGWNGSLYYETTEAEEMALRDRHKGYINLHTDDPLPLPVLQAAGRGLPIISVRNPTLVKLFGDEAMIFINDANDLVARMNKLTPDQCKKYGNNASKVVEKRFNRKDFKKAWEALIKERSYE
jgi:hypothetical protein